MVVFCNSKMQQIWDKYYRDLPDSLFIAIVTDYINDNCWPKNTIWNLLIGYQFCLEDNLLPKNKTLDEMISLMARSNLYNF